MKNNFILKTIIKNIYNMKIFKPLRKYVDILKVNVEKSIRFEVMAVVAICFILSSIFYAFVDSMMTNETKEARINYNYSRIENNSRRYVERIQNSTEGVESLDSILEEISYSEAKAYITDLDGNIIKKTNNVGVDKVDVFSIMANNFYLDKNVNEGKEVQYMYPITLDNRYYFIYEDTPSAEIDYQVIRRSNSFLALMLTFIVFIILFILSTNSKMKYLDEIGTGLKRIASGDLNHRIQEEGNDEIRNIAANINYMSSEINKKIVAERNAEKTKADLITNVSHDLRTPLTSIMGYIGLVKEGKYDNEETKNEYLNIAFSKAEKLKVLIEDLFEYTKLNNDGIKINKIGVNLTELMFQLTEELTPIFEENQLSVIKNASEDKIIVELDPDKMLRVFENLLTNAIKYSFKPGNITVNVHKGIDYALVSIRNKGKNIPKEKVDKLFDRFYRVDESRNTNTGGSGLGLAISKNIVELHGGQIWAECYGEDISFFVKLKCEN